MSSIGPVAGSMAISGLTSPALAAPAPQARQKQQARPNTSGLQAALHQAQAAETQARRQLASAMSRFGAEGAEVAAGQAAVSRASGAVRDAQAKLDASKLTVDIIA